MPWDILRFGNYKNQESGKDNKKEQPTEYKEGQRV